MPSRSPSAVFVYGTLKRGQCRESQWPRKPTSVRDAWTRGFLFDRHDYPAMTVGDSRVLGELWCFEAEAMPEVLQTLDQIEGTGQPGQPDLYVRVVLEVFSLQDQSLGDACTYLYASDPIADGFTRLSATHESGFVCWPSSADGYTGTP